MALFCNLIREGEVDFEKIGWVFLGSGLGGVVRYSISLASRGLFSAFPIGTLVSNLLGMFLIGYLFLILTEGSFPWREFILIGFLGGLTTFSTFGNDTVLLFLEGKPFLGALYLSANLGLGFMLLYLGRSLGT